jgi:phosphorylcholine metabolism protein LicD
MYLLTRLRLAARKGVSIREPSVRTYRKHGRIKSRVYLLMARILRKFTSHHYWNHRMEKVMALYPVENAQYVGNFTSQYGGKEMLEKSVFDSYIDMQFEGLTVMACKQYEKYLISIYGDYTKLPALKKRKGHHPGNIYWQ